VATGEVKLKAIVDGKIKDIRLTNVLHVPELKRKLISLGGAEDAECRGSIADGKIILRKGDDIKLVTVGSNGLHYAQVQKIEKFYVADAEEPIKVLHEQLAHISKESIYSMSKNNVAEGLKLPDEANSSGAAKRVECDACEMGKMAKLPIKSSSRDRASNVGEALHSDICGPLGITSHDGANYIVLFEDE